MKIKRLLFLVPAFVLAILGAEQLFLGNIKWGTIALTVSFGLVLLNALLEKL